ncbi:MAG: hypothetical protein ACLR43_13920 [Faecalibacillus faecis]
MSEVSNNIIYPMWLEMDGFMFRYFRSFVEKCSVYELTNKADKESVELVKQVIFIDERIKHIIKGLKKDV